MFRRIGQTITKYDVCALACRAYLKALTPINIQSGFRKTGIFPLKTDILAPEKLHACESFREKRPFEKLKAMKIGPDAVEKFLKEKEEMLQITNDGNCSCTQKKKTANIATPAVRQSRLMNFLTIWLATLKPKKQRLQNLQKSQIKRLHQYTAPNHRPVVSSPRRETMTVTA